MPNADVLRRFIQASDRESMPQLGPADLLALWRSELRDRYNSGDEGEYDDCVQDVLNDVGRIINFYTRLQQALVKVNT